MDIEDDPILRVITEGNERRRQRHIRSLSDVALMAYRERLDAAMLATPDEEKPIMALFDAHEMLATVAEMKRRGLASAARCHVLPKFTNRRVVPRSVMVHG